METIESVWVNFWNCYGISTGAGPLVGLINSVDDRRPTAVVAITEKSFLWIADLRVKPIAKVISFDEEHNVFLIGNKPVSIADLPALFEKLLSLITDYRVGWLRLVPRSKTRNSLGRNLYWDKIADSLAEKIHFLGAAEITSIGTPQHLILNGMLNGLSRLRRCAVFLSTSDLTLPWASMMEEKSPLDDALSNGFLAHIFTKTTEEILSTGVVEVAGKRLPVEVVYDLYCEFTQDSVIKRVFGKLDARWFGVATSNNDEDRQFFWLKLNLERIRD